MTYNRWQPIQFSQFNSIQFNTIQFRDPIFVKDYGFLSFANMGTNIGKNISKILNSRHNQKRPGHAKQSAADAFQTSSEKLIQNQRKQPVI